MKKISRLGIFDSGLGGYSIYRFLMDYGPDIEYRLYSDQSNAPYGNCSDEHIKKLAEDAMRAFLSWGIEDVILACNTVSSVALAHLRESFPQMRIWGIIDLTASQAKNYDLIDVVSTQATYRTHAYAKVLEGKKVEERPLPKLAGLIEDKADEDVIEAYIASHIADLEGEALLLACTHYPIVGKSFSKYYQGKIYDSRQPVLEFVKDLALEQEKVGSIYTSGSSLFMEKQIEALFGVKEKVEEVILCD